MRLLRTALVALLVMGGLAWLLQETVLDSRVTARLWHLLVPDSSDSEAEAVVPGEAFTATAYCKGQVTAAGVAPRRGIAASDPRVLPLGSLVEIDADDDNFDGLYSVLDTGPKIQGRRIDLYMWSCYEALDFGRQTVQVKVLRHGWDPSGNVRPTPIARRVVDTR